MQVLLAEYSCRGKLCRVHFDYNGYLNAEVDVLEPGVDDSLAAEDQLSPDGLQHYGVEFQGGELRLVMVTGGCVAGPEVQACAAGVCVLSLCGQVTAEDGFQRAHRGRGRERSEVKSRDDVEVEGPQVLEGVVGVEGVDLGGSDQVVQNDFLVSGIDGSLPVVLGHLLNPGQMSLYENQGQWRHRGSFGQMDLPRESGDYCRGSGKGVLRGQPCLLSHM